MPTKPTKKTPSKTKSKKSSSAPRGFSSPAWERVYLVSLELAAIAHELGEVGAKKSEDGFGLADAASELARLASNHDRDANRQGRTPEQEKEDWIAIAGLGADLGNMADEQENSALMRSVRTIAHELCYLACDYLF